MNDNAKYPVESYSDAPRSDRGLGGAPTPHPAHRCRVLHCDRPRMAFVMYSHPHLRPRTFGCPLGSCRKTAWDSLVWFKKHEFYPRRDRSTSLSLGGLVSKRGNIYDNVVRWLCELNKKTKVRTPARCTGTQSICPFLTCPVTSWRKITKTSP